MRSVLLVLTLVAAAPDRQDSPTPDPAANLSSAVSPLLPSLCVPSDGEAGVLRCSGLVGTDVYLRGPEEGRAVALGAPTGFPPLPKGVSRLSRSLTWRILDDRPIAAVVGYRVALPENGEAALLAVLKPAAGQRPGCLVGVLENRGGEDVDRAAAFADRSAPAFRCGTDRPQLQGPASEAARRVAADWLASAR